MPTTQAKKAAFDPSNVKVVKAVTLPILKKADDQPIFVTITSPIILGKQMAAKEGEAAQEPAHLCNVINLETGEEMQMIANTVLRGSLDETYPKESYVNKSFKIVQMKVPGKRYKNYSMFEIEA